MCQRGHCRLYRTLLEKIISVFADEHKPVIVRRDFLYELAHVPAGTVGRIIKEDESARDKVAVDMLEIAAGLVIPVITIDVGARDGAAKVTWPVKDISNRGTLLPLFKEVITGGFHSDGEIKATECAEVLDKGAFHQFPVFPKADAAMSHGCIR